MFKRLSIIMAACAIAVITGCAALGLPTADTFNDKLAAGYSTVTAVRQTATTLLNMNKLTADDGQNILEQTNNARTGLDIARTVSKVDMKAADGKLTAIRTVLTALQVYLATKQ